MKQTATFVFGACGPCNRSLGRTLKQTVTISSVRWRRARYATPVRCRAQRKGEKVTNNLNDDGTLVVASERVKRSPARRPGFLAAIAVAIGTLFSGAPRTFASRASAAATTESTIELRYDGRVQLAGAQKVLSVAMTGGAFAGLWFWVYRQNRHDDELEKIRIREEVERLDKLEGEFVNVVDQDNNGSNNVRSLAELSSRVERGRTEKENTKLEMRKGKFAPQRESWLQKTGQFITLLFFEIISFLI